MALTFRREEGVPRRQPAGSQLPKEVQVTPYRRAGGRGADQLRAVSFETDYIIYPEGSVLVATGRTKVLCNASVEEGVPAWMMAAHTSGGWVTAEYALLPRSTHERTSRETLRPRGRTQEIRRLIGRSLRAAVELSRLPRVTITIDCDVLQADGGTRTASITGGYVALALALSRMVAAGEASAEVFASPVSAVSVGMVERTPLLDLDYQEDSAADVDANIVMNMAGEFIELQATAEGAPLAPKQLEELLDLAAKGCRRLFEAQRSALAGVSDASPFPAP